jgi:hypothetical protein
MTQAKYAEAVKKTLGTASEAVLLRDPHSGRVRLAYASPTTGHVGIIDPKNPAGGTFLRPTSHKVPRSSSRYLSNLERRAGDANAKRLDLAKVRDPRVPAKPLQPLVPAKSSAEVSPKPAPARKPQASKGVAAVRPKVANKPGPAAKPARRPVAKPASPSPATGRPAIAPPKPVPSRPVPQPTVAPAPKPVPPRPKPPITGPRTPVRPPPPATRPPARPPGGAPRPGR